MHELPYEPIDHTADAGFRIVGESLPALFENSALCIFEALGVIENVSAAAWHDVEASADDLPGVLRSWLSELLYVSYVQKLVLVEAKVTEVTETRVRARVRGAPYDEDRHERHPEIKAVTWHGLKVERTAAGYAAEIILDL